MAGCVIILTGERGVGKSTVCRETIALAQAKRYACGGVLTLSSSGGAREVLDVGSGYARRLTCEPGVSPSVIQGDFRFDPETLAWGDDALIHALGCHLLVVDELGPLEVEREEGWLKAFDVVREGDFALALVVIRPELMMQAQLKLRISATTVITVTPHNRDDLPSMLLEVLEGELRPIPQA